MERDKKKHPMLSPCKCSERRQETHGYDWSLNKDKQNIWISNMVETVTPILPRKKTIGKRERRYTKVFHIENDTGEKITVCQKMFLSTLGLTTDKTIQTVLSKSEGSRTISDVFDKRGKRIPGNKISNDT